LRSGRTFTLFAFERVEPSYARKTSPILDLTIKGADKTRSAIPSWAKERIAQAWNVTA
jgi:hypothetical protein